MTDERKQRPHVPEGKRLAHEVAVAKAKKEAEKRSDAAKKGSEPPQAVKPTATVVPTKQPDKAAIRTFSRIDGGKVETSETQKQASEEKKKPKRRIRWGWVIFALIMVVVVGFGSFIGYEYWNHWTRYDDAADIQGEWKIPASNTTAVIDDKVIHLTKDVAYSYTIDDHKKILSFTFGSTKGEAAYRFSADRQTLVIDETGEHDFLVEWGLKPDPALETDTTEDEITVLVRISDDTQRQPQDLTNNSTLEADTFGAAIVSGEES